MSWLLAQGLPSRRDRIIVTCSGLIPDLDGLSLLAGLDAYGRYHHLLTHRYPAALGTLLIATALAHQRVSVAILSAVAFHLHLLCDLAGNGPGWPIQYLWPTSNAELFWSGQWDLASWQNSLIGLVVSNTLLSVRCAIPPYCGRAGIGSMGQNRHRNSAPALCQRTRNLGRPYFDTRNGTTMSRASLRIPLVSVG